MFLSFFSFSFFFVSFFFIVLSSTTYALEQIYNHLSQIHTHQHLEAN